MLWPFSRMTGTAPLLSEASRAEGEVRRGEEHALLELTLDGTTELVHLGAPHVALPALALERDVHGGEAEPKPAVAVDPSIAGELSHLHRRESVGCKQPPSELFELAWGQLMQTLEQLATEGGFVLVIQLQE